VSETVAAVRALEKRARFFLAADANEICRVRRWSWQENTVGNTGKASSIIVVRKKVVHHGGHHGGAWKVAYADFVTAMMALFIVLWLMASSDQVKKSIAAYFLDPQGHTREMGSGVAGSGESMFISVKEMENLKHRIEQALRSLPEIEKLKDQITMTITGEGLRIELVENANGVFFENGSAQATKTAQEAIGILGSQLGQLPNSVVIEGHTDATPYGNTRGYTNWELSTDRAHTAHRIMQDHGVRLDQVKQIRGYADQNLRNAKNPTDPANRRISVIVLYQLQSEAARKALNSAAAKVGSTSKVPAEAANGPANSAGSAVEAAHTKIALGH
jgi:chemotaxis protein MotB